MNIVKTVFAGLTLALGLSVAARANLVEVVGNAPFSTTSWGQQSDASTLPAYTQAFTAPANTTVEAIRWWGFHGVDSLGADYDNFVVMLGSEMQTGALTVVQVAGGYYEYPLDIADTLLSASTLSIVNDSSDVEWFWQSATATGNPGAADEFAVAFSLLGYVGDRPGQNVPEPTTYLLVLLAMGLLVASRRVSAK